jgi:hypothetical protein
MKQFFKIYECIEWFVAKLEFGKKHSNMAHLNESGDPARVDYTHNLYCREFNYNPEL